MEGLIFGGAYLRREICVSKSIGLALQLEVNLSFLLCFTLYLRVISKYKPPGALYLEGRLNGGFFLRYWFGGLIFGGAYFRNFTVFQGLGWVFISCLIKSCSSNTDKIIYLTPSTHRKCKIQ